MNIEDKFYFGLSISAKAEIIKKVASDIGVRPDSIDFDGKYVNFYYKGRNRQADVEPARKKLADALWPYGAHGADIAVSTDLRNPEFPIFKIYASTRRITKTPVKRYT